LLDNLARTAPDRFEWIACVPETSPGMVEFLKQKPGAKGGYDPISIPDVGLERWSTNGGGRDSNISPRPPPL
jgi:hypothetical protein